MSQAIDAIFNGLSPQRLGPYLRHSKSDPWLALAQYRWNLQLSESLYPLIHLNEVVFRNALHNALTTEFETEYWFKGLWLHTREQQVINKVLAELHKRYEEPSADQVIAELTFGFWCSLCDSRYEHKQILWPKLLKHTPLKSLPKRQRQRKEISRAVNRLRQLRNRIFHHEPVWHWRDLKQRHHDACELLDWLNPEVAKILHHSDHFKTIYSQGINLSIEELYR